MFAQNLVLSPMVPSLFVTGPTAQLYKRRFLSSNYYYYHTVLLNFDNTNRCTREMKLW